MDTLVSVVIPAYNAAAFIENCIESILNQSYPHFEIVVINDGSKDNTLEILNRLAEKDKRIRVFSQKNGGVSAARNTALTKVRGEFLTYVDADDSMEPRALEYMLSCVADDVDYVVASHNDVRFKKVPYIETPRVFTPETIRSDFIAYDAVNWWPWAKLFRTSIILDNHLQYNEAIYYGEDHIFNLLFSKYIKNKVIVTDKIVYNYHYIRGGICSKYYDDMNVKQKQILLAIADFFGGKDVMPYEYKAYFTGAYTKGRVEYYSAWLTPGKAAKKIEETFEMYSDYLDDKMILQFFSEKQFQYVKQGDFLGFTKDYIIKNPKRTLWRKLRRTVRRFLELQQRIFLKRK